MGSFVELEREDQSNFVDIDEEFGIAVWVLDRQQNMNWRA